MKQSKIGVIGSNISAVTFVIAVVFMMTTLVQADNPIVQTLYTADPAPLVHNGVCYVYTTHDEDVIVDGFFTMNDWRCYSSTDMVNWTDLGSPLSYTDFTWASGAAWAGQCVYRNGKFYFYVPMARKAGGKAIGVAVATSPAGPFSDPLGHPLVDDGDWGNIDPTVFIDDDGQAYLYWGNPFLRYVKLNADMISYSGSMVDVPLTPESFGVRTDTDRPSQYEEGPWFYKRNGLYYMVFAAGPLSEHISYSTSPGPTGPWTFGGIIMPTQGGSFTNHPGVCDYLGNSYFFYHNGALPDGHGLHRSVCVEKFTYNADGTFPTINMTTAGPAQIGNLNPYVRTEAETICWESGIETETCSEGGVNVCAIENGDYIKVEGVDFGTGAGSFLARVASANAGNIELRLNSLTGTLIGTCVVPNTGGTQAWTTAACNVSGASGIHDLYLKFTGSAQSSLFNVNWWQFQVESVILTNVTVDPSTLYQTIEGLGGAICFYNGWFTAHPYKNEIFDHAFSGLNLSMLRVANWWRGTNGQDTTIYEIVTAANQRLGHPVPILMTSWSPPAYLKSNGEVANGGTLIQIDGAYDYAGFADYWYNSLQDYKAHGVNPTWIGIQNEPDWTADYDSCRFNPSEASWGGNYYASFALAQDAVYNRLQSMTSPPKLLGPECVGLYGNASALRDYMAQMNANTFYGIAHHLYGGSTDGTPDGYNSAFTTIVNSSNTLFPGKPKFMTEFGDIKGLIPCANLIHNSLAVEQVSGYNHWCLMWPGDIGLVEIENPWGSGDWTSPKGYWLNPSYWSMKHYSYYIQPGFRRVNAISGNSNVLASTYLSPDYKRLVTVLINRSTTSSVYMTLNPGSFVYDDSSVYQTVGENHFVLVGPVVGSQLTLPASSVTTVLFDHHGPVAPTDLIATMVSATQVGLTWTASPDAISYNVKRSTISGGPYTVIAANVIGAGYSDITVTAGTKYYYVVSAFTPEGHSDDSAEATPPGLRTHLKFDETSGTTAYDATGNNRSGTLVNGPLWSTLGKYGNAVDLDGSNDYVTLPTGVVSGLTSMTISTWVYLDAVSMWTRIFDFGTGTNINMFLTPLGGSNVVRFAITTGGAGGEQQINGSAAIPTGVWTHVSVTLSGSTGILYVNGAEVGRNSSMTLTPNSLGNTTQNYIGKSQYSDPYLNGRVDDFRIYSEALNPTYIAILASGVPFNSAPYFTSDSVNNTNAIELASYTGQSLATFAGDAESPGALTFSKVSGPQWLTVASNGILSGIPLNANVGANAFTVQVTDNGGLSDTATMNITVANIYSGVEGINDLLGLASQWLASGCTDTPACQGADLDGDADVDLADFSELANYWLIPEGIQLYLKLNETSGTTAADDSGYSRQGTLTNGPAWSSGHTGGALSFDGSNDYVVITGYKGVTGSDSRTCCAWIKTTATGAVMSWGRSVPTGGDYWYCLVNYSASGNPGALHVSVMGGNVVGTTDLRNGEWHHIAVVFDSDSDPDTSDLTLYVDGIAETVSYLAVRAIDTMADTDVYLGSRLGGTTSYLFSGQMDEVRIYNRALSVAEITALAQ